MTDHAHTAHVDGCYRCGLSLDEARHQMRVQAATDALLRKLHGSGGYEDARDAFYDATEMALAAADRFDRENSVGEQR